jgi:putative ATPase
MKDLGHGDGYQYDHDADEGFSGQNYFPDGMERQQYFWPTGRGFEESLSERLALWQKMRADRGSK